MYRLDETTKEKLMFEANKYSENEFQLFVDELGWEDWMNSFTDADEGEAISETECKEIDKILKEVFEKAHQK